MRAVVGCSAARKQTGDGRSRRGCPCAVKPSFFTWTPEFHARFCLQLVERRAHLCGSRHARTANLHIENIDPPFGGDSVNNVPDERSTRSDGTSQMRKRSPRGVVAPSLGGAVDP